MNRKDDHSAQQESNLDLKILCVDDEPDILEIMEESVRKAGFTPVAISNPENAIDIFKEDAQNIALVICDFKMPKMNGIQFRKAIFALNQDVPFIILSAFVTTEMALEGLELKINSFLNKPIKEKDLIAIIDKETKDRVKQLREIQMVENTFVEEANHIVEHVEEAFLELDKDRTNIDLLKSVAREIHTLKGSSGFLSVNTLSKYVHKYEDIISSLQKGELEFTDNIYRVLFVGLDRIKELVASVTDKTLSHYNLQDLVVELKLSNSESAEKTQEQKKNQDSEVGFFDFNEMETTQANQKETVKEIPKEVVKEAPKKEVVPVGKKDSPKAVVRENISVPINMLDDLSSYSGEITVLRNMINKIVRSLESQYSGNKEIQSLGELLDEMHKINSTIQTRIVEVRKVPLSQSLKSIPRIVHDLSHDLGKKIDLQIEGDHLRVDNTLATVCNASLVHLVRNSVDHGIEFPPDRTKKGKNEKGIIRIECEETNEMVLIRIRDDGGGIPYLKIKEKALEKGIHTESELERMSEKDILQLIFAPGFSTAAKVTDVSGRGVGMDMVKSSVESVGGEIDISTKVGEGTTFTLKLPVPKSVLIINSLLVEANRRCFAIPQDSIIRILRIESEQAQKAIVQISSGYILKWNQTIYPLLSLKMALKMEISPKEFHDPQVLEILIVRSAHLQYALHVDAILDSEEIVVKRLQPYFNINGIYTGATFMGDGSIGLILDIKGIAEICGVKSSNYSHEVEKLQKNILQKNNSSTQQNSFENYLLFRLSTKALFGVPLNQVFRLEEIEKGRIQYSGAQEVFIYRDGLMPLYEMHEILGFDRMDLGSQENDRVSLLVVQKENSVIGLKISQVVDIVELEEQIDKSIRDRQDIVGNVFVKNQTVTVLDIPTILSHISEIKSRNIA